MSQVLNGESSRAMQNSIPENTGKSVVLSVENLRVSFARSTGYLRRVRTLVKAVDNVSFKLYKGEVFSLVGESGSGKTTIANCLMKLVEPDSGAIKFESEDVTRLRSSKKLQTYKRNVQIVYQDPFESLNPRWDVFTTISIPIRLLLNEKGADVKRRVIELIEEVGLEPDVVISKFPHQLSGGERQRVNIARALACNPKFLIADEPVTMLDASQRLNILSLLTKLKHDRNLTVLLITHDLASAKLMSNRMAIMLRGRIVEAGPTSEVLSRPMHPYTKLIFDTVPGKNRIQRKPGSSQNAAVIEEAVLGCSFRLRCKYATEVCATVEPELLEKSPFHMAACHNSDKVDQIAGSSFDSSSA